MGIVTDWRKQLKLMMEAPFPEYEKPPVKNTLGGGNIAQNAPPSIPVIDVDDDHDHCSIDCEALKDILLWAGCDQTQADKVVEQTKLISKEYGVVKAEHLKDILTPASQVDPQVGSRNLGLTPVVPVAPNGLMSNRQTRFNENLRDVMNDEDVEIVTKKKEK